MSEPSNKNKLDVIKAGVESIKSNYYKAAIAYFNASKDEVLAKQDDERIRLIEKSITMCFLAQKNKELHQLICQHDIAKRRAHANREDSILAVAGCVVDAGGVGRRRNGFG